MSDVPLATISFGKASSSQIDHRLTRRVETLLGDLGAFVPRLHALELGELVWSVKPVGSSWGVQLSLVPRRQGWLFHPLIPGLDRPQTLEEEAALVWEEIRAAPIRILRAGAALKERAQDSSSSPDPMMEVVFRRSRQQWLLERERQSVALEFPDVANQVDAEPIAIRGVVRLLGTTKIYLTKVIGPPAVGAIGELLVCSSAAVLDRPASGLTPGQATELSVRLRRCPLTRRVVGAEISWPLPSRGLDRDAGQTDHH